MEDNVSGKNASRRAEEIALEERYIKEIAKEREMYNRRLDRQMMGAAK